MKRDSVRDFVAKEREIPQFREWNPGNGNFSQMTRVSAW